MTDVALMSELSTAMELAAAKVEIGRLQEAKRRALQIADERSKENVALRNQLGKCTSALEKIIEMWGGCSVYHAHDIARAALSDEQQ